MLKASLLGLPSAVLLVQLLPLELSPREPQGLDSVTLLLFCAGSVHALPPMLFLASRICTVHPTADNTCAAGRQQRATGNKGAGGYHHNGIARLQTRTGQRFGAHQTHASCSTFSMRLISSPAARPAAPAPTMMTTRLFMQRIWWISDREGVLFRTKDGDNASVEGRLWAVYALVTLSTVPKPS